MHIKNELLNLQSVALDPDYNYISNMSLTIDTIREHILTDILNDSERELTPEEDLLLSGTLDSLNVVRLVAWLEKECQISIPAEDVVIENFGSLNQIKQYLNARTTG